MPNALALSYDDLRRYMGREISISRTPAEWDSVAVQDIADCIRAGLRKAYWPDRLQDQPSPHRWSFLEPTLGSVAVEPAYAAGTIDLAVSTVTLTGGTWPAWTAGATLISDGQHFTVATRDSDTQLTVSGSGSIIGGTYELVKESYALPTNFAGIHGKATIRRNSSTARGSWNSVLTQVNESMLRQYRQGVRSDCDPQVYCVIPAPHVDGSDQQWLIQFFPYPREQRVIEYRYQISPSMMGATNPYHDGGAEFSQLVLYACLDQVARSIYGSDEYYERYLKELDTAVKRDMAMHRADSLGFGPYSDGYSRGDTRETIDRIRRQSTIGNHP